MKIRWLLYKSAINPETGEYFAEQCTYRKLQVLIYDDNNADEGTGGFKWVDVPEIPE